MSEAEEVEEQVEETTEEQEYTETEQKALEMGWQPEGVEGKRALSAEEFLDRKPLYDDLRKRGKEIRDLRQEIDSLRENDKKVAERMYQMALNDLKKEKKAAYDEGDTDRVLEIDDNIRDLDKDREAFNQAPQRQNNEAQEAFSEWVSNNPWYQNDPDLAAYADGVGPRIVQENPHLADKEGNILNHEEFLNKVTERTKRANPDKFKGSARRQSVESDRGNSGGSSKKKYSIKSLDAEDQAIAKRVIEATGMKEEDYMKQILGE